MRVVNIMLQKRGSNENSLAASRNILTIPFHSREDYNVAMASEHADWDLPPVPLHGDKPKITELSGEKAELQRKLASWFCEEGLPETPGMRHRRRSAEVQQGRVCNTPAKKDVSHT